MTISEKILAAHSGKKEVKAGEFIQAKVDLALGNDITAPLAIKEFYQVDGKKVFDPKKIVFVLDHFTPNKDILSAENCKFIRQFAQEQGTNLYSGGNCGIEHALLPEEGLVIPGSLIIGADSHTCTYGALGAFACGVGSTDLAAVMLTGEIWLRVPETIKIIYYGKLQPWVSGKDLILYTIGKLGVEGANYCALEFTGEVITSLPQNERFTICNMAVEAGAKNGIIELDDITSAYLTGKTKQNYQGMHRSGAYQVYRSDSLTHYKEIIEIDCNKVELQVAYPSSPANVHPVRASLSGLSNGVNPVSRGEKIYLDQVVIGSCTNGWLEDLRIVAKILNGKKVYPGLRLLIIPATPKIYLTALKEGLIEIFLNAGAVVAPPTCGPCLGGHLGILAQGERCLSTTNRNFRGRMGHPESEVYLASPAVAAVSAVFGRIAHPDETIQAR
jgi:3-isopropylmalate/(R)-2-methylmalate dehydratase large subunit